MGSSMLPVSNLHLTLTMISFISFPAQADDAYRKTRHYKEQADDAYMDFDDEYEGQQSMKLTCPGETLTSAQDFMRSEIVGLS